MRLRSSRTPERHSPGVRRAAGAPPAGHQIDGLHLSPDVTGPPPRPHLPPPSPGADLPPLAPGPDLPLRLLRPGLPWRAAGPTPPWRRPQEILACAEVQACSGQPAGPRYSRTGCGASEPGRPDAPSGPAARTRSSCEGRAWRPVAPPAASPHCLHRRCSVAGI